MKRSDTDIRRDVEAALQWDPSIDDRKTGSTQLNRKRYPAMALEEAITRRGATSAHPEWLERGPLGKTPAQH
jgi:hypothetical protein